MKDPRLASVALLTAASAFAAMPVFAGQVVHRTVSRNAAAPVHRVHVAHPAVERIHRVTRVERRVGGHPRHVVVEHPGEVVVVRPAATAIVTAPAQAENAHRWGTSIAASSAILTEASPDSRIIKHVPSGTHIPDIIGEVNGFYQYVRWTHKIAYVAKSDVQLGSGVATAEAAHEGEPRQ